MTEKVSKHGRLGCAAAKAPCPIWNDILSGQSSEPVGPDPEGRIPNIHIRPAHPREGKSKAWCPLHQ